MLLWLTFGCAVSVAQVVPEVATNRASNDEAAGVAETPCTIRRSGQWVIAETQNFEVWSRLRESAAVDVAQKCEAHRARMSSCWLGETMPPSWSQKCCVVVHNHTAEFTRHVGSSLQVPVGCTTITSDHGRIIFRRIDLRLDAANWQQNALPHELAHVALADAFPQQELPAWLNEGLAMTFETEKLRNRRIQLLRANHEQGGLPTLHHVISSRNLTHSQDADTNYAACLSIVSYLHEHEGDAKKLLRFARQASHEGCETALNDVYGIAGGVDELERRWRDFLRNDAGAPDGKAIGSASRPARVALSANDPEL